MQFDIDVVLRDTEHATTERASHPTDPASWTEEDVRAVLTEILAAIARVRDPAGARPHVALRGFSWIVEPWDAGDGRARKDPDRVVIAVEIPTGAAVAGPFDVSQARLDALITRALASPAALRGTGSVH
jgi:hypothetical protein